MTSIRLSPKFGLNPSLSMCFFCQKAKNEVVLPGQIKNKESSDVEAPHKAVWNMEPCETCAGYMGQGVLLISVDEALSTDKSNPYRTGGWCVVKEDFIRRAISESGLAETICKQRVAFLPDEVWDRLGLPRGPVKEDG